MKRGIGFWKTQARRTLKGNFLLPITATFLVSAIQFIAGMFAGNLFPGGGVLNRILQEIFLFAIALIMCIFTAGLYYMYLNMSRGLSYGLSNLVYFFKNQPDRVIVASFVLALISWLTSLPAEWYSYTTEMGDSLEAQTAWAATYLLIMMVFMVVNLFVSIPFAMTYYILADEEEIGGFEALKRSICMMEIYSSSGKLYSVDVFIPVYHVYRIFMADPIYGDVCSCILQGFKR